MVDTTHCEYCGREIKGDPEIKVRRGIKYVYCSEFCFRLDFYDAPDVNYEKLQDFYEKRTVSMKLD
jgi:hypothetical protein